MRERLKKLWIYPYLRRVKKKIAQIRYGIKSQYRKLKSDKSECRIIMLDTPEHGNLGDHAIALATKRFLMNEIGVNNIYEFTYLEYQLIKNSIRAAIKKEDLILLPGGGFIGTLWPNEQEQINDILNTFPENSIVVFPHTIYFEDSEYGSQEIKKFHLSINGCSNLTIITRDRMSYDFVKTNFRNVACLLTPDIVTYYVWNTEQRQKNKIMLILRDDKERIIEKVTEDTFLGALKKEGYVVEEISTCVSYMVDKENRETEVIHLFNKISEASLVITDRLHGMLFAAVTGTPCIALDNVSRKVSGQYEWIQYLGYIKQVETETLSIDMVEDMLKTGQGVYSNKELKEYYDRIKDVVLKGMRGKR